MANYEFDGISTESFNPDDKKEFEEFISSNYPNLIEK